MVAAPVSGRNQTSRYLQAYISVDDSIHNSGNVHILRA